MCSIGVCCQGTAEKQYFYAEQFSLQKKKEKTALTIGKKNKIKDQRVIKQKATTYRNCAIEIL